MAARGRRAILEARAREGETAGVRAALSTTRGAAAGRACVEGDGGARSRTRTAWRGGRGQHGEAAAQKMGSLTASPGFRRSCVCRAEKNLVIWERNGRCDLRGGPFFPGRDMTRDKRVYCPGSWHDPGQKPQPFVPGHATTRDKSLFRW